MATLQQQLPYSNLSLSEFKAWGQGVGTAMTAFAWTQSGTASGQVNWGTIAYWPLLDQSSIPAQATMNFRGAYANGVTYATNDVATYNGSTWWCISGYTSSATTATPGNDIGTGITQHWRFWAYEVWQTAVSPTLFLKFEYAGQTSFPQIPRIRVTLGTSVDANGNLGTGAGNQQVTVDLISSASGILPELGGSEACWFSGDSGNRFGMLLWNDSNDLGQGSTPSCFFCMERSLGSTGAYYTTPSGAVTPYATVVAAGYNNNILMQSLVNTTGSTWVTTTQETGLVTTLTTNFFHAGQFEQSGLSFPTGAGVGNIFSPEGVQVPCLPIYPLVGWVGNPMTAAMSIKVGDTTQNGMFTQVMYGSTRTYFGTKNSVFGSFGNSGAGNGLGMRYD